jgi:cell division septum initiation protein DivIVA
MARREPNDRRKIAPNASNSGVPSQPVDFDIYQDLARLQEMIFDSFHLPLTRWTLVDEGSIAEQIDLIYETVPPAVQKALAILQEEREIIDKAEEYAEQIVRSAQQRAAQILDESGIIQQAERQASQIRQQVQQECESVQQQTLDEIEQMRQSALQEVQQLRQKTFAECNEIQKGADDYAEAVLEHLDRQLGEMLQVIRNGRQQVRSKPTSPRNLPGERR